MRNTAFSMLIHGTGPHSNYIFYFSYYIVTCMGRLRTGFEFYLLDTYVSQLQATIRIHDLGSLYFAMARNNSPQSPTSLPVL
jgi:hypothetical protein